MCRFFGAGSWVGRAPSAVCGLQGGWQPGASAPRPHPLRAHRLAVVRHWVPPRERPPPAGRRAAARRCRALRAWRRPPCASAAPQRLGCAPCPRRGAPHSRPTARAGRAGRLLLYHPGGRGGGVPGHAQRRQEGQPPIQGGLLRRARSADRRAPARAPLSACIEAANRVSQLAQRAPGAGAPARLPRTRPVARGLPARAPSARAAARAADAARRTRRRAGRRAWSR